MTRDHVIGIDQGTSGTKAVMLDGKGRMLGQTARALPVSHPAPGLVEQDAEAMVANVLDCARELLDITTVPASAVAGFGIDNHTESLVLWERDTGRPVHPVIVWQCRRSTGVTAEIDTPDNRRFIRDRTGLDLDPTFTATKLRWIMRYEPEIARALARGEVLWGTVDSWLLWRLSDGALHATDYSNASRTMLFNIGSLAWDSDLVALFDLDPGTMPRVIPSGGMIATCARRHFGAQIPLTAVLGDQQASLFGHGCLHEGAVKSTYGTGAFVWMNGGHERRTSAVAGGLETIAWHLDQPTYALEGFVMYAGAILDWLVNRLRLCGDASEVIDRAQGADTRSGVILVPAFQGLASPWWNPHARAAVMGLDASSDDSDVCLAALEAICFQVKHVLDDMKTDGAVRVDGGLARSDHFLQLQADILARPVIRSAHPELTAYGIARMAGVGAGLWAGDTTESTEDDTHFEPRETMRSNLDERYQAWCRAVELCLEVRK